MVIRRVIIVSKPDSNTMESWFPYYEKQAVTCKSFHSFSCFDILGHPMRFTMDILHSSEIVVFVLAAVVPITVVFLGIFIGMGVAKAMTSCLCNLANDDLSSL